LRKDFEMANEEFPAYIARCKCGAIIMATVDVPEHAAEVAKEIAKCVREGYAIERVTVGYVRQNWSDCTCKQANKGVHADAATAAAQPLLF
jgi:hypothetical protein